MNQVLFIIAGLVFIILIVLLWDYIINTNHEE